MKPPIAIAALLAVTFLAPALGAEDDAAPPPPIKVLMVTGGCCHDYPKQKDILAQNIAKRARVQFEIVHLDTKARDVKADVYKRPNWAKGYDVVLHNECFGAVDDVKFVEGIAKAHAGGVGAVMIHCSIHSYRAAKTEAWRECLGVTSVKHQKHRPFEVKNLKADHPVMKGFPESWKTPQGELYEIIKLWPNTVPLGQAYGEDSKKDHVCIWVNTYGKGRVFGTTIGHHNETMLHETYLDLVTRGLLWSAGKLDGDGKPAKGYQAGAESPSPAPLLVKFIGNRRVIIGLAGSPTAAQHAQACNCGDQALGDHKLTRHPLIEVPTFEEQRDSPDLR